VALSGVIVGGSTATFVPGPVAQANQASGAAGAATFTLAGQTHTATQSDSLAINRQTLSVGGGAITVGGQVVSIAPDGIVIDETTHSFTPQGTPAPGALVTLSDGTVYSVAQNEPVILGSKTISAGGIAATVGGQVVSIAPNGIVVDGTTKQFGTESTAAPEAVFTLVNGRTYSVAQGGALTLGSRTVSVGGSAVTVGDQVISLASDGVVITPAASASVLGAGTTMQAVITLGSETLTAIYTSGASGAAYVADGTTLTVGGADATIDGQIVSAALEGIVIDGSGTASRMTVASSRLSRSIGSVMPTAMPSTTAEVGSGNPLPSSLASFDDFGVVKSVTTLVALCFALLVVML